VGPFVGQLQPYALYVPEGSPPAEGWGFTFLLHSWTNNHNEYVGTNYMSQLVHRGSGSVVTTPLGRGPDGVLDIVEADAFEVWADVARHHRLDPEWVAATGYSMGGGTAFFLATRWPDLFARAAFAGGAPEGHSLIFPVSEPSVLPSLRNMPVMTWIGTLDEGTDLDRQEESVRRLEEAGLRFVFDQFLTETHFTLPANDEWQPLVDFLGEHRVDRDPPHISYVVDSRLDSVESDLVADHAYWLSELRLREGADAGTIDANSEAFGVGLSRTTGVSSSFELLEGGALGPKPYHRRQQDWEPASEGPGIDRLVLRTTDLAEVTVDVRRARLSCNPELRTRTDGPLLVHLDGCNRTVRVGAS
jgi:pimeloyl-ACP methyl ester carboxylesterase